MKGAMLRWFGLALVLAAIGAIPAGGWAGPEKDPRVQSAIEKVYPALVRIDVVMEDAENGRMKKHVGAGSGAIISPDGYVVTNHHVAGNATRMVCRLADGEEVEAKRIGTDPLADIAVVKLKLDQRKNPSKPLAVANWGDSESLRVGDTVLAMGCPMAVSQSVTVGVASNTQMVMPKMLDGMFQLDAEDVGTMVRWIGHDAVIFGGNSGGPLVNVEGKIIGINEISLGSLGGAIPANLAKKVAQQLIESGQVKRSWIGVDLQPRLKSGSAKRGALVASVVKDSPAEKAGLLPGDVLTQYNGQPIDVELREHLPLACGILFDAPVGKPIEAVVDRGGKTIKTRVSSEPWKRAMLDPSELKEWGIAVRDITPAMARARHRADTRGVFIVSCRASGAAAASKLPLTGDDIITRVGDRTVNNTADLVAATKDLLAGKEKKVPVLVEFDRKDARMMTVVRIGADEPKDQPAQAKKPWLGMTTQVLTADLAESLGLKGKKGVRVTRVLENRAAAKAGIQVGDVLLSLDGRRIEASESQDQGVFDAMVRRLSVGGETAVELVRDGKPLTVKLPLEAKPVASEDLKSWTDDDFEFSARDLTVFDRIERKLPDDLNGALIEKVENGGWAALGGLQAGDIVLKVADKPIANAVDLKNVLAQLKKEKPRRISVFVRRGIPTRFCEIEPDYP